MKHRNKNRMLAGVFAVLFVMQAGTLGLTAFADETEALPTDETVLALTETEAQTDVAETTETTETTVTTETTETTETAQAAGETAETLENPVLRFNETTGDVIVEDTNPLQAPSLPADAFVLPSGTVADDITLNATFAMPDQITQGGDVAISGSVVSSASALRSLTVGVYSQAAGFVTGMTINPNADAYNIANLDNTVRFDTLTPGNYIFAIIASNSSKSDVYLMTKQFEVRASTPDFAGDVIGIVGSYGNIPPQITQGTILPITGVVTSSASPLSFVSVAIYNADNNARVTSASAAPNAQNYDLSRLDDLIAFNQLPVGNYIYRITASNASKMNEEVAATPFTVVAGSGTTPTPGTTPSVTADTLTLTGMGAIPSNIPLGGVANVTGTVTSAVSDLLYVTACVYDSAGKPVTGKSVSPGTKTYDLNRLDAFVRFDALPAGEYTYAVIASNAANSNYILNTTKFTVGSGSSAATPGTVTPNAQDTITSSNVTAIPDTIRQYQPVSVRGTVTSAVSNLTRVTVCITDTSGGWMSGKTVDINSKVYDISNLDSYVLFDKLPNGIFNFKIIATNASNREFNVFTKSFTVGTGVSVDPATLNPATDNMSVSDMFSMPDHIDRGSYVSVSGTAYSSYSNITSLAVAVYDNAGNPKTGRTVNPNSTSYNLRNIDRYVLFNELPDGEYTFAVIASNASRTNEALYTKKFTVGSGTSSGTVTPTGQDKLTVSGVSNIQGSYKLGTPVSVYGTVSSESTNLTSVTAGVYDYNNNLVTGKSVSVNAKSYDLKNLDSAIRFDQLGVGNDYTFRVYASNGTRSGECLYTSRFIVSQDGSTPIVSGTDTLSLSNPPSIPDSINVGGFVTVSGTVSSASSNIISLSCGVYDSNGLRTGRTVAPNAKSYNLSNLDADVKFNELPAGTYTFAVIATNSANSNYTVYSKKFTVGSGSSTTPTNQTGTDVTITNGTSVPNTMAVGQILNVKGIVRSDSPMTSVTVGVYDTTGAFKTGGTAKPNTTSYDLANLDAQVEFNKLPAGSYVYAVRIANSAHSDYILVNKSFTVGSGSSTPSSGLTNDSIAISGGTQIPDSLPQGKTLSIFGTVTSGQSSMTSLTCGVFDGNGNLVTGRTINPNARTYDLHKLDVYIEFNVLPVGNYSYVVMASNASNSNVTLVNKRFSIGGSSSSSASGTISLSGGTSVPSTISKGGYVNVRGTVTSNELLQNVSVVISTPNSTSAITGGSASPNSYSYNLANLDNQVRFDQLNPGTYVYTVYASTASKGSQTLTAQTFVVQ